MWHLIAIGSTLNQTTKIMTNKSKKAIQKWGIELVRYCFYQNYVIGNGGRTISQEIGITTRQADSLISAGHELFYQNKIFINITK